jgi:hypothetical protein
MLTWKQYIENIKYQGDSNPMQNIWIDTWHQAQQHAISGNYQTAINMMMKAANQAAQKSPGEAKYYLATAAWLSGNKEKCQKLAQDKDVKQTGNHKVLHKLLKSKSNNYNQAYK